MKQIFTIILALFFFTPHIDAQEPKLSREQILNMSIEELSDLPLEELMDAVATLGVSSVDELFALIMNKNVASASKKEENAFCSPLSSSTLTRAEIMQYGANTIEEALRLVPGVVVQEKTSGNYDVYIRGLNNIPDNQMLLYTENANTLLMIDGRVCHNYAIGAVCFDMLPITIADIERIEVVRGATSALYGTNAVQGVINIITTKPNLAENTLSGSLTLGSSSSVYGNLAFNKKFNNFFSAGVTFGIQHQGRNTDRIYLMPNANLMKDDMTFANGGYVKVDELSGVKYATAEANVITGETNTHLYDIIEPSISPADMFEKSNVSRHQCVVNGYLSFNPGTNVNINISAGYQNSLAACSPVSDDFFSLNYRTSKTAYVNLDAGVYDLQMNVNYSAGPQNFAEGVPGFKERSRVFSATAAYDLSFNMGLSVRPEVYFQSVTYEDDAVNGYFNGSAKINAVAPSIRLDYSVDGWRIIGAYRSDKTNIPDKWNHSWQGAVSKSINEKNFARLSYSRAMRSANLTNTSANYTWNRESLPMPQTIHYVGNEEADIMHIDNYELGYRLKPSERLLIDAEVFYSRSTDYGSLASKNSMLYMSADQIHSFIGECVDAWSRQRFNGETGAIDQYMRDNIGNINNSFSSQAVIQYQNLPYEVHQAGITLGIDWIITGKLIAKINLNAQQTRINDYYAYNQASALQSQLNQSRIATLKNLIGYDSENKSFLSESFVSEILTDLTTYDQLGRDYKQYINDIALPIPNVESLQMINDKEGAELYKMAYERARFEGFNILYGMDNIPEFALNGYESAWFDPADIMTNKYLSAYYSIKYDIRNNGSNYFFASQDYQRPDLKNNHKHSSTPSFYGSVGLLYKPVSTVETALNMSFIGRREYETMYGVVELNPRFSADLKIGYYPVKRLELFFNAKNLLNNRVEFPFADKCKGTYMCGITYVM